MNSHLRTECRTSQFVHRQYRRPHTHICVKCDSEFTPAGKAVYHGGGEYGKYILVADVKNAIERHRLHDPRAVNGLMRFVEECINSRLDAIEAALFKPLKPPADAWRDPLHAGLTRREIPQ